MTRVQFLNELYRRLGSLRQEQAEQYLTYYAEMLADRMEEGMTEEEAVASMEDIGTIARRILQDEGVSWHPPRYPDPPGTQNAYHPLRASEKTAWDWREPARIGLWVLAIVVAVWAIANRFPGYRGMATGAGESAPDTTFALVMDTGLIEDAGVAESASEIPPDVLIGTNGIFITDEEYKTSISSDGILVNGTDGVTQLYIGPDGIQIGGEYSTGWNFGAQG